MKSNIENTEVEKTPLQLIEEREAREPKTVIQRAGDFVAGTISLLTNSQSEAAVKKVKGLIDSTQAKIKLLESNRKSVESEMLLAYELSTDSPDDNKYKRDYNIKKSELESIDSELSTAKKVLAGLHTKHKLAIDKSKAELDTMKWSEVEQICHEGMALAEEIDSFVEQAAKKYHELHEKMLSAHTLAPQTDPFESKTNFAMCPIGTRKLEYYFKMALRKNGHHWALPGIAPSEEHGRMKSLSAQVREGVAWLLKDRRDD